jgi:hypothetical protein
MFLMNVLGLAMPFWTLFWLIVPPVVLLTIGLLHFFLSRKAEE